MSDATAIAATHEVLRPGISLGGGKALRPGDRVDASGWSPRLRHLWEQRGAIRPLPAPGAPVADAPAGGDPTEAAPPAAPRGYPAAPPARRAKE